MLNTIEFDALGTAAKMCGSWVALSARINTDGPLGRRIAQRWDDAWMAWASIGRAIEANDELVAYLADQPALAFDEDAN